MKNRFKNVINVVIGFVCFLLTIIAWIWFGTSKIGRTHLLAIWIFPFFIIIAMIVWYMYYLRVIEPPKLFKLRISKKHITPSFQEMYYSQNLEYSSYLEKLRKKPRNIALLTIFFSLFFFVIFNIIIYTYGTTKNTDSTFVALLSMFILTMLTFYFKHKRIYVREYKDKVIGNMILLIDSHLRYIEDGNEGMIEKYSNANFTDKPFRIIKSEDYIHGYITKDIDIELCEIILGDINEKNERMYHVCFDGIFSYTSLIQALPNEIFISTKRTRPSNKSLKRTHLDYTQYNKVFRVYTENELMAWEILTPDIMQIMIDFYQTYHIKFEIIMKNRHVYIRFHTGSVLEPNVFGKYTNLSQLWMNYCIIDFSTKLTNQMNKIMKEKDI